MSANARLTLLLAFLVVLQIVTIGLLVMAMRDLVTETTPTPTPIVEVITPEVIEIASPSAASKVIRR